MTPDEFTLRELVGDAALEALFRPIEHAEGLPGLAYHSPAFFALEQARLFRRTWVAVTTASGIPAPGDLSPSEIGTVPLVLVRNRAGAVNAFVNICRHRGQIVVSEPCRRATTLRCPYHRWTYDLDGHLVARPNPYGGRGDAAAGLDRAGLGLRRVRAGVWLNTVFVNIDGNAPPLEEHVRPLIEHFANYDFALLADDGQSATAESVGNWKLAMEGGVEDYHLRWVHPQLFAGDPPPTWKSRVVGDGKTFAGVESRWDDWTDPEARASEPLPPFPGLNAEETRTASFVVLFPNFGMTVLPDQVMTNIAVPLGPERTLWRDDHYFIGDAASDPKYARRRRAERRIHDEIGEQDDAFMPNLQRAQAARDAVGLTTRFAPQWDAAVLQFQRMLVERLRA